MAAVRLINTIRLAFAKIAADAAACAAPVSTQHIHSLQDRSKKSFMQRYESIAAGLPPDQLAFQGRQADDPLLLLLGGAEITLLLLHVASPMTEPQHVSQTTAFIDICNTARNATICKHAAKQSTGNIIRADMHLPEVPVIVIGLTSDAY